MAFVCFCFLSLFCCLLLFADKLSPDFNLWFLAFGCLAVCLGAESKQKKVAKIKKKNYDMQIHVLMPGG